MDSLDCWETLKQLNLQDENFINPKMSKYLQVWWKIVQLFSVPQFFYITRSQPDVHRWEKHAVDASHLESQPCDEQRCGPHWWLLEGASQSVHLGPLSTWWREKPCHQPNSPQSLEQADKEEEDQKRLMPSDPLGEGSLYHSCSRTLIEVNFLILESSDRIPPWPKNAFSVLAVRMH